MDKEFRIISDAYPYIASRLLTDSSAELQSALQQLLFKDGKPRWERLEDLLEVASETSDYDSEMAIEQLLLYLVSDRGTPIREILSVQLVEVIDQLGADSVDYALALATSTSTLPLAGEFGSIIFRSRFPSKSESDKFQENVLDALLAAASKVATPSDTFLGFVRTLKLLTGKRGFNIDKVNAVFKKVILVYEIMMNIIIFKVQGISYYSN